MLFPMLPVQPRALRPVVLWFVLFVVFAPAAATAQTSAQCLACHSDRSLQIRRSGQAVSLFVNAAQLEHSVHGSLDCVHCHAGLNPATIPHARKIEPVNCGTCHDIQGFQDSIHAQAAGCKDCHGTHDVLASSTPRSRVSRANVSKTCGACHTEELNHYARSAHGSALSRGARGAPTCVDCHESHTIHSVASKESPAHKQNEAGVCLRCHVDNPDVRQRVGVSAGFVAGYQSSVHGVQVAAGNLDAAVCSDCHSAHDIQKGSNPASTVYKPKIPATCGKCHGDVARIYGASIHGTALRAGNRDSPSCTDCHGEHQIFAPQNPQSSVAPANVSARVCAVCHGSLPLTEKYGLAAERFRTFEDSYHGLAAREGAINVANCASCHGFHDIRPSWDPASKVNKANLAVTCGQCHPGATENFGVGPVHVQLSPVGNQAVLYWIRSIYIGMIVVIVGGMVVHNLLDFVRKSKLILASRRGQVPKPHPSPTVYVRMNLSERLQHGVLLTSFVVLVITGFMLKFPDAWWVVPLREWSPRLFAVRSATHRVAAVLLVGSSLYHLYYLFFVPRGKRLLADMLPRLQDMHDMWRQISYNLGMSQARPLFDRFGYVEKLEYWALLWGTAVMSLTGIILWFDNFFINLLTKLGWDAARMIHYYEAWLATLAIVVWHFYFVIFNPNVYPMNMAWLNGKLTEEEMEEEHPRELERIRADIANREDVEEPDRPEVPVEKE